MGEPREWRIETPGGGSDTIPDPEGDIGAVTYDGELSLARSGGGGSVALYAAGHWVTAKVVPAEAP